MSRQGVQWLRSGASTLLTLGSGGASSPTGAFAAQTYYVRVAVIGITTGTASGGAFVKIGDGTPTADTTGGSLFLPANVVDYFVVTPGQKLSAIAESSAAKLTVTEMQ